MKTKFHCLALLLGLTTVSLHAADAPGTNIDEWLYDPNTAETDAPFDIIYDGTGRKTEILGDVELRFTQGEDADLIVDGSIITNTQKGLYLFGYANTFERHSYTKVYTSMMVGYGNEMIPEDGPTGHQCRTSFLGGLNNTVDATAAGNGNYCFAWGYDLLLTRDSAAAFGSHNIAGGTASFVAGNNSETEGDQAVAIGSVAFAKGDASAAFNNNTQAMGDNSVALNDGTIANGVSSLAAGNSTTAEAYSSVAIGRYNVGLDATGAAPSGTTWQGYDPVFEIGIGADSSNKANAVTVYKDGSVLFDGAVVITQRQGDILMGDYGY